MKRFLALLLTCMLFTSSITTTVFADPEGSAAPVIEATEEPTDTPTEEPTDTPTEEPTAAPTEEPTAAPTEEPTAAPTEEPTAAPTEEPTAAPTEEPTAAPTEEPTDPPTEEPTDPPTEEPMAAPTEEPTAAPTEEPTAAPTEEPTAAPTEEPTAAPTEEPTAAPTEEPTAAPTEEPDGGHASSGSECAGGVKGNANAGIMLLASGDDISLGSSFTGTLSSTSDVHTYSFYVSQSGRYRFSESAASKYIGIGVYLGSTFISAVGHYTSGSSWCVDLEAGNTYTVKYYVDSNYSSGSTSYTQKVTLYRAGTLKSRAQALAYEQQVSGSVAYANDFQIYTFTAGAGSEYRLSTYGSFYHEIEVWDSSLNKIAAEGTTTTGTHTFDVTLTPGNTYYAVVHGREYDGSITWLTTGSYTLTLSCLDDTSNLVSFTMDKTSVNPGFNDSVTFTVSTEYASKVRVLVDGEFIMPTEATVTSGKAVFSESFHQSGSRSVQIQGYRDGEWSILSAPQTLTVNSAECLATPVYVSISNNAGTAYRGEDYELQWEALPNASRYNVYVYSANELIYTTSTTTTSVTIPGSVFESLGIYYVDVYALANVAYQQSEDPARATITVEESTVTIQSISSTESVLSDGTVRSTFTLRTSSTAAGIGMYAENGTLIRKITSGYTTSGSYKTWTFSYDFGNDGDRILTFKTLDSSGEAVSSKKYSVALVGSKINSVTFNPSPAEVNKLVTITVKTNIGATKLRMYTESGTVVNTWDAASYSTVSGGVRTWKVTHTFTGIGARTLTFKTTIDGTNYNTTGKNASLTVNRVALSVSSAQTRLSDGTARVTFTVKTSTDTAAVAMYSESGSLVKKVTSGYTTAGAVRTWKFTYDFGNDGSRTMTFKALNSSGTALDSKQYSFKVEGLKIHSVAFSKNPVTVKSPVTITVKTNVSVSKLGMYSETGAVVKTWNASDSSKVSSSVRIWTLSYTFSGAGARKLTFKTSYNGTNFISTGTTTALTVETPDVTSASVSNATLIANLDYTTITANTSVSVLYLHLIGENGAIVKTWDAATYSKISGSVRVWTVSYQFAGSGTRKIQVAASADKVTIGKTITLTFNVVSTTTVLVDKTYAVKMSGSQVVYFVFKPTVSKTYTFSTTGSLDTFGVLYRSSDGTKVVSNDDSGTDLNFSISQYLTAGRTYVIAIAAIKPYGGGTATLVIK